MTTSYSNFGGSGPRSWITVALSGFGPGGCAPPTGAPLVEGTHGTDDCTHATAWDALGTAAEIKFDLGLARVIDEFKWYQSGTANNGTWKWAGSNDDSTYTDLHTGFTLGGAASPVVYSYTNTTVYRYYKLIQTGGNTSAVDWIEEIEFKIDQPPGGTTWNPADQTFEVVISGPDAHTATLPSTSGHEDGIRATTGKPAGKLYLEFNTNALGNSSGIIWGGLGFYDVANALSSGVFNGWSNGIIVSQNGTLYIGGSAGPTIGDPTGHVLGFAIDLDAKLVWAQLDGTGDWNGSGTADPATGVGGVDFSGLTWTSMFPAAALATDANTTTLNTGGSTFTGTIPSGFAEWDSAPPTPTGTWASTEPVDTFAASGYIPLTGTLATTEAPDTFSASDVENSGVWASTEAGDTFAATGPAGPTPKKRRVFFAT
jgi:hypothetical protein